MQYFHWGLLEHWAETRLRTVCPPVGPRLTSVADVIRWDWERLKLPVSWSAQALVRLLVREDSGATGPARITLPSPQGAAFSVSFGYIHTTYISPLYRNEPYFKKLQWHFWGAEQKDSEINPGKKCEE